MNDSDSAALVQKIAGGDTSAMMTLYDRTNRLLYGLVLRILPESAAGEEALLEAYTRLWRQAEAYDPRGGTPLAWMLAIARTCAIERMRGVAPDQRRPESSEPAAGEEIGRPPLDDENGADVRQQLLRSAVEAAPPDYIRDLLALRIEREPRAAPAPPPQPQPVEPEKLELKHTAPPRPITPPVQPRSSIVPWMLAVLCAVAAALFFFFWRQTQKQSEQAIQWQRDAAHEARAEADRLRSLTDTVKLQKNEIDALDAALSSPGASVIYLAARRPDSLTAAAIFWDTRKNAWIVFGHLAPAPAGKEYQLWFVTPNGRKSAGLVPIDASGHGFAVIDLPPDMPRLNAVEITLEPMGGSEQPTSPAVATGKAG